MLSSEQAAGAPTMPLSDLSDSELQQLLASAVKAYAGRHQEGARFPAFSTDDDVPVTGTDAVITASAILDATGVEIFELGLWKAWGTL